MAKSFLGNHKIRGLRNNNPGNLVITSSKWQGKIPKDKNTDGKFEQFQNVAFGIRAMLKDIIHDVNKGKNTVHKIISEYSPPHENNTLAYIDSVSKSIGVKPNEVLTVINAPFLLSLARAILKVELGQSHKDIVDADIIQSIKLLGNVSTLNLTVDTNTNFFFKYMQKIKAFYTANKKLCLWIGGSLIVLSGFLIIRRLRKNGKR